MKFIMIDNDTLLHSSYNEQIFIYDLLTDFLNYDTNNYKIENPITNKSNLSYSETRGLIFEDLLDGFLGIQIPNHHIYSYFDYDKEVQKHITISQFQNLAMFQLYLKQLIENNLNKNILHADISKMANIRVTLTFYNDKLYEEYEINDILSYCLFVITKFSNSQKVLKICQNCNDYFVPSKRSDALYCDKLHDNDRTCKDMGYENKVKDNEVYKEYRKVYKRKHAFKQRQIDLDPNVQSKFDQWVYDANLQMQAYNSGEISKNLFLSWLHNKIIMEPEVGELWHP